MEPQDIIDLHTRQAEKQIEMTHAVMEKHLNESDRIHARRASESLVKLAGDIVRADPTEAP